MNLAHFPSPLAVSRQQPTTRLTPPFAGHHIRPTATGPHRHTVLWLQSSVRSPLLRLCSSWAKSPKGSLVLATGDHRSHRLHCCRRPLSLHITPNSHHISLPLPCSVFPALF
uniref:Uncharacterized protein n=1 Tax=Opuntia streptacantha TaxID=393608 RepID=A0A7C9DEH2_OPUST